MYFTVWKFVKILAFLGKCQEREDGLKVYGGHTFRWLEVKFYIFWLSNNSFVKIKTYFFKFQYFRFWKHFEETSKANEKIVKALLKVVRQHLTPPPSSTNVERLFSYGGLVATDHRSTLSGEKLDQILFLRENALMANFDLGWL